MEACYGVEVMTEDHQTFQTLKTTRRRKDLKSNGIRVLRAIYLFECGFASIPDGHFGHPGG